MLGRGTQRVPLHADLHFCPAGSVEPIHECSDETGWVILGQEVIECRWEQPTLFSIHWSKRHEESPLWEVAPTKLRHRLL